MTIEEYWEKYKKATRDKTEEYTPYYFCNNEEDARKLAELVVAGKKRATASCAWMFEHENEPIPKAGDVSVITDFSGNPKCVVKTTRVDVVPFRDVTADYAATEGEGDLSLEFWQRAHKWFFTMECETIGREFSIDMPVVCERFEVVYI